MDEILKNMDIAKSDRLINSALEEFSIYPYEKASTNNIVKNARISKGLLYHYFTNKKRLYDSLSAFALNLVVDKINNNIDWDNGDFFVRIKQIVSIKMEITKQYPHIYDFIILYYKNMTINEVKELSKEVTPDLMQKVYTMTQKVYTYNIDYSLFTDDIDIKKALSIINWTFEKSQVQKVGVNSLSALATANR